MAVANQLSHKYFASQLRIFVRIYIQGLFQIPHSVNMPKNMEDLQEELQKLVDDGPRLDEDQAKMVKVAACLLAATAVKQARNKRLRNDRRKKSVWVREWLLSRDKYGMYEKLVLVVFDQLFYELSLELPVLIVLLSLVVVDRMVQPELCHYMLWRSFVQAYCFSSTFPFLCSVVADDSESRDSTGGGVSCGTGEADGSPDVLDFPFPLPFGGISTNCLTKKLEAMEMSQLTAFENDELLSRDLFANELGLNSDRIATLRTN